MLKGRAEGCVLASAQSEDTAEEAGGEERGERREERGEGREERGEGARGERESRNTRLLPLPPSRQLLGGPGRKHARWSILRIFEKSGLPEGARGAPAAEAPPAGLPRRPFIEA